MNSAEFFQGESRTIQSIYKVIFEYLKKVAEANGVTIEAKTPSLHEGPLTIDVVGGLRTTSTKTPEIYLLGFSEPNAVGIFHDVFTKKAPDPKEKSKEHDLMKALFQGLDAEAKTMGKTLDPKQSIIVTGLALGGWKKIEVQKAVKMPIGTKSGEIVLTLPLFDHDFSAQKTIDFFGFPEDTRILVVDDSATSRVSSRQHLAMAGYFVVDECVDGQAAITKLRGSRPPFGLVVADWHMPNMSGMELLKKIRATEEIAALPVILATGERNKEEISAAIKEGVTGYLLKPLAPESFFKSLKQAADMSKRK